MSGALEALTASATAPALVGALNTTRFHSDKEVTYYFDAGGQSVTGSPREPGDSTLTTEWSSDNQTLFRTSIDEISAAVDVTFREVTDRASADIVVQLAESANGGNGGYATIGPGSQTYVVGGGQDGVRKSTIVHEMGHVLGLAHPHSGVTLPGVSIGGDQEAGDFGFNATFYSIMSYRRADYVPEYDDQTFARADEMGTLDLAALQQTYGANTTTRTGNDVYGLLPEDTITTIWDAGGRDRIDFSLAERDAVIDLRPATITEEAGGLGAPSFVRTASEDDRASAYFIPNGVTIEAATGGMGNDVLTGNTAANELTGNAGSDLLTGGAGDDSIIGGSGDLPTADQASLNQNGTTDEGLLATNLTEMSGAFTLELSVRFDDVGSQQIVYYDGSSFEFGLEYLEESPGDGRIRVTYLNGDTGGGARSTRSYSETLADGEFHRIAFSRDANGIMSLYLDGEGRSIGNDNLNALTVDPGGTLNIGGTDSTVGSLSGSNPLQGEIREVALYDTALSVAQIDAGSSTELVTDTSSLVAHWVPDADLGRHVTQVGSTDLTGLPSGAYRRIETAADDDTLIGGAGNDTLIGGPGVDTAVFEDGRNFVSTSYDGTFLTLQSSEGIDLIHPDVEFVELNGERLTFQQAREIGGSITPTLLGTSGPDVLRPTTVDVAEIVDGLEGNDVLFTGGGNDTVDGGLGQDEVSFLDLSQAQATGLSIDLINGIATTSSGTTVTLTSIENASGSAFDDFLAGDNDANVLNGNDGADTLRAGQGADTMDGGNGADLMVGAKGADIMSGGNGNDTMSGENGFDIMGGGAGADMLEGNDGNDVLRGGSEADALFGNLGDDSLWGGNQADALAGGGGNDLLNGGNGRDTIQGGSGNDVMNGDNGDDVLDGGTNADLLAGGLGNDSLVGSFGRDTLTGGKNADTLLGGDGFDYLAGGNGLDSLAGGLKADTLVGGAGADTLKGGLGNDRFVFADGFGTDVIEDFSTSNTEIVDLRGVSAIADWADLQANHLRLDAQTGFFKITAGADSILLQGVTDLAGYGEADFLF